MSNYKSLMKHRKLTEQKVLYEAWERSGLTKSEFCRQNNISKQIFHIWIKQLQSNNYINDDGNKETLNILNNVDDDRNAVDDNASLETESIKFLKVSRLSHVSSQKSFSLESSSSSTLEISLPNKTVIRVAVSQNYIDNFLQEIIRDGNRSTI